MSETVLGPERAWYPVCRSGKLKARLLRVELQGRPLVLFRDASGRAAALVDRCPHRNAPLSAGRRRAEGLECGYHGWTFDGDGRCLRVPGFSGEPDAKGRRAESHAAVERDGLVFVWARSGDEPSGEPFPAPHAGEPSYTSLLYEMPMRAGLHAAIENILDVPHTAFLHGGLFRSSGRSQEITATVRRRGGLVEAEYAGEPRPTGLAGRLFAPGGGTVRHFDRFSLPAVAQVEYAIGERSRLVSTSWLLPEGPGRTRLFARIRYRTGLPGALLLPLFAPIAWIILRQDASMLEKVTRNTEAFGGERHSSTELDLLGAEVARLLKSGIPEGPDPPERSVTFRA